MEKKYRYVVEFADPKEEVKKGVTTAPSSEHAHIKLEQFWGRQSEIKTIEVAPANGKVTF